MPKILVALSDEEDTKLEQYKAAKKFSSKEKAIKSLIQELNITIKISENVNTSTSQS
jgi:hypothetical protein